MKYLSKMYNFYCESKRRCRREEEADDDEESKHFKLL